MASSGFTRRASTDLDTQPVAIVSVDTVSRHATGLSRSRTEIDIFTDYAVGGIYVTPVVGEQWQINRIDGQWRLDHKIPFNDPSATAVAPVQGQNVVGSPAGPLELNASVVNINSPTFTVAGAEYRIGTNGLEKNTGTDDVPVWTILTPPINPDFAPVQSVNGQTGDVVVTADSVGLGNVDNTPDENKPVSAATAAALSSKADLSGGVLAPTQVPPLTTNNITGLPAQLTALTTGNAAYASNFQTFLDQITGSSAGNGTTTAFLTRLSGMFTATSWQNFLDIISGKSSGSGTVADVSNRLSALNYSGGTVDASKLSNLSAIPPGIPQNSITGLLTSLGNLLSVSYWQNFLDTITGKTSGAGTTAALNTRLSALDYNTGAPDASKLTNVSNIPAIPSEKITGLNASLNTLLPISTYQSLVDALANALGHSGNNHTWADIESYFGIIPPTNVGATLGGTTLAGDLTAVNSTATTAQSTATTAQTTATTANTNAARKAQNDTILGDWLHTTYPLGSSTDTAATLVGGKRTWWGAWNDNLLLLGQMLGITPPTVPASDVGTAVTTAQSAATSAQTTANTANSAAGAAQTSANNANTAAGTAQSAANTAQTTANTAQTRAARKAQNDLIINDWLHQTYPLGAVTDTASTLVGGKRTWWGAWNDNLLLLGQMLGIATPTDPASDVNAAISSAQSTANTANSAAGTAQSTASSAQTAATTAQTAAGAAQTTANTAQTNAARKAQNDTIIGDWFHTTYPLGTSADTAATLVGGKRTWWGAWNDNLTLLGQMLGIAAPTVPPPDINTSITSAQSTANSASTAAATAQSGVNATNTNLFGSTTPSSVILQAAVPTGISATKIANVLGGTNLGADVTAVNTSAGNAQSAATTAQTTANTAQTRAARKAQNDLIINDWLHATYPLGTSSDTAATLVGGKRTWWGAWNDNLVLLGQMLGITAPTDPASDVGTAISTAQTAANTAQSTASGAQTAASTAQTNLSSTLTALTGSSAVPTSSTPITSPINAASQLPSGIPATKVAAVLGGSNLGADVSAVNTATGTAQTAANTAQTTANTAQTRASRKAQNDVIVADWLHQTYPLGSSTDTAATLVGGKRTWWGAWNDNLALLGQMLGIGTPTDPASDVGAAITTAQTAANSASTAAGTAQSAANAAQSVINTTNTNLFGSTTPGSAITVAGAVAAGALPNIPAGSGPGQSSDLLTHLNAVATAAGATAGTPLDAATQGMNLITNTLSGLSAQLQQNATQQSGASNSGQSFFVYFPAYANWAAVPVNTTYGTIPGQVGSHGTGQFIIDSNGHAAWSAANNGDVSGIAIYNGAGGQAYTNTDYQKLQASLAGLPNGGNAKNFCVVRANAITNPGDYVYGVVYLNTSFQLIWELGCYIGGTQHFWGSGTVSTINLNFTMIAGVGNDPNRYQGFSGSTLVFDHVNSASDSGGLFPVNSSHRYWGFRSDTYNNGQNTPAAASYVGIADNQPPTIPGSGVRIYRTQTSSVGQNTGLDLVETYFGDGSHPFFDAVSEKSSDMTVLANVLVGSFDSRTNGGGNSGVQVANAGRYSVTTRVDIGAANTSAGAVSMCPALLRFNSAGALQETKLMPSPAFFVNGFGGQYNTGFFGGSAVIGCQAGDILQLGYWLDPGTSSTGRNGAGTLSTLQFTGEASGGHTYFEVALANWSFN